MSDKVMCEYYACAHFSALDDGEDDAGNPYPPNLYCAAADEFIDEYGQECVAPEKKEARQ